MSHRAINPKSQLVFARPGELDIYAEIEGFVCRVGIAASCGVDDERIRVGKNPLLGISNSRVNLVGLRAIGGVELHDAKYLESLARRKGLRVKHGQRGFDDPSAVALHDRGARNRGVDSHLASVTARLNAVKAVAA